MTILRSECWQPDFIWKWTCHQLRPCWFSFSFDYSFFLFCLIFFCFFFFFIQSAISVADGIASFICNALVRGNDGGVFQRVVASLCLSLSLSVRVSSIQVGKISRLIRILNKNFVENYTGHISAVLDFWNDSIIQSETSINSRVSLLRYDVDGCYKFWGGSRFHSAIWELNLTFPCGGIGSHWCTISW